MKNTVKSCTAAVLALIMAMCFAACTNNSVKKEGVWENAQYLSDKEFGNGSACIEVEVKAEDKSVTFTVNTDKKTLGDALSEHRLIEGEQGEYGLYVKKVNGITADYEVDKSYWSFSQNGEMLMTGVDSTEIKDGEHYEIVYTK